MSIFLGYPSLGKCADDTARSGTSSSPDGSCCQPSGSHYRPKPRDRKQPKASEQSSRATEAGANSGSLAGAFRAVIDAVAISILLTAIVPFVGIVCDDADIRLWDPSASSAVTARSASAYRS